MGTSTGIALPCTGIGDLHVWVPYGESNCLVAAIVGINKIPQICASDDVQLPVHMMIMYWDMCTSGSVHLMICAMHIQE
jgi:hypothetical protein